MPSPAAAPWPAGSRMAACYHPKAKRFEGGRHGGSRADARGNHRSRRRPDGPRRDRPRGRHLDVRVHRGADPGASAHDRRGERRAGRVRPGSPAGGRARRPDGAGGQRPHRARRRHPVAGAHEPHRGRRPRQPHHDRRGGRRPAGGAGVRRRARPHVPARSRRAGQRHHRRQHLDERRRQPGDSLRHDPGHGAGPRGGARGRGPSSPP